MPLDTTYLDSYNKELVLDLTLNAWSVMAIEHDDDNLPRVHAYMQLPNYYLSEEEVTLTDSSGVPVVDGSGALVTSTGYASNVRTNDARKFNFKFLTSWENEWTFSEYREYSFYDWVSIDGVGSSFDSYLVTGYNIAGDMARYKQSIYLQVFCKLTEEYYTVTGGVVSYTPQSSCMVQAQWDWADSAYQGKWGEAFQAYRLFKPIETAPSDGDVFDYGDTVVTTKNKLRGRGRALSLYMYSEAGKDLKLQGWSLLTTINGEP